MPRNIGQDQYERAACECQPDLGKHGDRLTQRNVGNPYSAAMSIVMPRGWVRPGGPAARFLHTHPARWPLIASHLRGGARRFAAKDVKDVLTVVRRSGSDPTGSATAPTSLAASSSREPVSLGLNVLQELEIVDVQGLPGVQRRDGHVRGGGLTVCVPGQGPRRLVVQEAAMADVGGTRRQREIARIRQAPGGETIVAASEREAVGSTHEVADLIRAGPAGPVQDEEIGAGAAREVVETRAAGESIIARPAIELVIVGAAEQEIVAGAAAQRVAPGVPVQRVGAVIAAERIAPGPAGNRVVASLPRDDVVAAQRRDVVVPGATGDPVVPVGTQSGSGRRGIIDDDGRGRMTAEIVVDRTGVEVRADEPGRGPVGAPAIRPPLARS